MIEAIAQYHFTASHVSWPRAAPPTRESWLLAASEALWPILEPLPSVPLRLSCGWPARRALGRKRRVGECWNGALTADKLGYVFISPYLDRPGEVLATLLHEMIHAALRAGVGHKGPFARAARAAGLVGRPTATVAGPALTERLNVTAAKLGPYPHVKLDASIYRKQTTRLRLYECACGVKVRVASDDFDATCNECGEGFEQQ